MGGILCRSYAHEWATVTATGYRYNGNPKGITGQGSGCSQPQ